MKQKRILVISAVPSHPQNQGNRRRIYNMLSSLKNLGNHITFVYFRQPLVDSIPEKKYFKEMKECWDEFYAVPLDSKKSIKFRDRKSVIFIRDLVQRHFPRIYYRLKAAFFKRPNFIPLDGLHCITLDKFIKDLLKKKKFDAVLVQYIFISKVLDCFDSKITKIIDAHDVFTDKHKSIIKEFKTYGWISATREEEARALSRADTVIAIQDKEKEFFSKLISKKIVTIGHLVPEINRIKPLLGKKRILFVGSENDPNVHGIRYFIKEVFPKVKAKFPDARLLLAGKVCNVIGSGEAIKLGELKDIDLAYDIADVVISPMLIGTGLKIKNIEALSYCKPLITTSFCAKELGKEAKNAFLTADTPEEFVNAITKIFSSQKLAAKLSRKAHDFMKKYNAGNLKTLKEIFDLKK